jgi:hypothetical protein
MKIEPIMVVPVAVVAIVIFIVNFPDLIGMSLLTWFERTNASLKSGLVVFAVYEGFTTHVKLKIDKR